MNRGLERNLMAVGMRTWVKFLRITLVSVIAAVAALLLSVAVRAYFFPVIPPAPSLTSFSQFMADNIVGYRYKPLMHYSYVEKGRSKLIHVYYDRYGVRVGALRKESRVPSELVTIGGSQTWGQGVEAKETFSAQLANALHLHAVNLGVSSYGGVSSLLMLKRYVSMFKPKYIVYGFWEDHINRNVIPCVENGLPICVKRPTIVRASGRRFAILPSGDNRDSMNAAEAWYHTTHPGYWFSLCWTWKRLIWNFKKIIGRSPQSNSLQTSEGKREATRYVLHKLSGVAKKAHAKLIVVFIPLYFNHQITPMPAYIGRAAKKDHFILVNMEAAFRKLQNKGVSIAIPKDGHMSPRAHLTIAEQVKKKLKHLPKNRR